MLKSRKLAEKFAAEIASQKARTGPVKPEPDYLDFPWGIFGAL